MILKLLIIYIYIYILIFKNIVDLTVMKLQKNVLRKLYLTIQLLNCMR